MTRSASLFAICLQSLERKLLLDFDGYGRHSRASDRQRPLLEQASMGDREEHPDGPPGSSLLSTDATEVTQSLQEALCARDKALDTVWELGNGIRFRDGMKQR